MKLTYTIEIETIDSGFSCKTFVNGKEQAIFISKSLKEIGEEVKTLLVPSFESPHDGVVQ